MMHKAGSSIEEVSYCFWRSSVKFQGHTGWKIDDLDPIWVRLLGRSQLSNPSDLPCYYSSPPIATYMRQWTGSALVQVMACCLFGTKPLPEPMLVYCQLYSWEQISVKFKSEFYHFHSRKCIWNCHLPNWQPFCPGEDELKGCILGMFKLMIRLLCGGQWATNVLTYKQLQKVSIAAADALVLSHKAINIQNADAELVALDQFISAFAKLYSSTLVNSSILAGVQYIFMQKILLYKNFCLIIGH